MKKWQLLLVLVVTTAVYLPILGNGLVIDDHNFIEQWEGIKSVDPIRLLVGDVPAGHEGVYRPLRGLLYQIYYQLFGQNPFFYHLHALVVHLITTALVYLVAEEITKLRSNEYTKLRMFPLMAALLFGLLPAHVESIAYLAASMEMWGVTLILGAVYTYLSKKRWLSVGLATMAYFTYEIALVTPLLIMLIDWCWGELRRDNWEERWQRYAPYWAGVAIYGVVRWGLLGIGGRGPYLADSPYLTFLTMGRVLLKYLEVAVWPVKLAVQHVVAPGIEAFVYRGYATEAIRAQKLSSIEVGLPWLIIFGMLALAVWIRKRHPLVTLGIGWWFIGLLPVMEIVPQGSMMNEKMVYLASVGVVSILAYAITKLQDTRYKLQIFLVAFLVVFYGWRTYQRTLDWKSDIVLWTKDTQTYPDSAYAYYSLGNAYFGRNDFAKAIESYGKAAENNPHMAVAVASIARTYGVMGEKDKAREYYLKTLDTDPNFWEARVALEKL